MTENREKIILIIDDCEDNHFLLKTILTSYGIRSYSASNGQEALSLLQELFILPDLILLDAQMPIMDGYQFREAQSKSPRLKSIPVVVMSADHDLKMNIKMKNPRGILTKPFQLSSVFDSVINIM